jgi:hypothetical protein
MRCSACRRNLGTVERALSSVIVGAESLAEANREFSARALDFVWSRLSPKPALYCHLAHQLELLLDPHRGHRVARCRTARGNISREH